MKLEREGYAVQTATTGWEAMKMVREDPPDLIFLDDTVSEVDGCQTASCLKKDVRTATIPLVMLKANADWERGRSVGADDYLVKPCSFKCLMRKVEEYLDRTWTSGHRGRD